MNIVSRALKGIFWSYANYFWQRLLNLATTAILARLLVPSDFGLVASALIVMTMFDAIRNFGINDALIYTSEKVEESADTAFIINSLTGLAQYAVVYLLAPFVIHFFDDPRLVDILRVIALGFIFDGLGKTHDALLQKELKFKKSTVPEISATTLKGIASIALAWLGYGVWSIVIGQVIGAAAQTAAKWWALGWVPRLRFHMDRVRALWNYGVHVLLFSLLVVALDLADQTLIGTMLGQEQLGYYSIGVRFPELIIANFSLILSKTLFPTFSKINKDIGLLRSAYLLSIKFTAFATVPAGLGMVAVAREVILIVFGTQWEPAIILMQVLALLGVVSALMWSVGDTLKALGRPDISTKILVIEAIYTFPMIYFITAGTRLAVMASLANLIAISIGAIIRMVVIARMLEIKSTSFFDAFRSPFASAIFMGVVIYGWQALADPLGLSPIISLIVSVTLGAVIYAVCMWWMEKASILEARDTILNTLRRKQSEDETAGGDFNETTTSRSR